MFRPWHACALLPAHFSSCRHVQQIQKVFLLAVCRKLLDFYRFLIFLCKTLWFVVTCCSYHIFSTGCFPLSQLQSKDHTAVARWRQWERCLWLRLMTCGRPNGSDWAFQRFPEVCMVCWRMLKNLHDTILQFSWICLLLMTGHADTLTTWTGWSALFGRPWEAIPVWSPFHNFDIWNGRQCILTWIGCLGSARRLLNLFTLLCQISSR